MPKVGRPVARRATLRRILGFVGLLLLVLVVGTSLVYAVPQIVGAEQSYVVLSGSMEPAIGPGDVILVDSVPIEAVQVGDVVTFNRGEGAPTTHRVIDIVESDNGRALVTKGDANEEADPGLVHANQLVGRVMTVGGILAVIPAFGYLVDFANSNMGAVLVVFLPLTLFLLNEVYVRLGDEETDERPDPGVSASPSAETLGEPTFPADPVLGGTAPAHEPVASGRSPDQDQQTVGLGRPDLTLTLLVLAVVVPYSGWMLLRTETTASAMVFAGAAVGLTLIGFGRFRLWLRARRADDAAGDNVAQVDDRQNGDPGPSPMEFQSKTVESAASQDPDERDAGTAFASDADDLEGSA